MVESLVAKVQGMRDGASGLETVSADFHGDRSGQTLSESGSAMAGFALQSACVEVGGSLTTQTVSLADDLSEYSGKVFAAADAYERGDEAAAERIDFTGPEEEPPPVTDPNASNQEKIAEYEQALREAGLLDGPVVPGSKYEQWLLNAQKNGVRPETIVDIARTHDIDPEDFSVLDGMKEVKDADGKSFFMVPPGTSAEDIKKAALMTYVLNAGTGYDAAEGPGQDGITGTGDDVVNDFEETPYSAAEVQRIIDRQNANSLSYDAAAQLHHTGGAVSTTPNGMLMALGGKPTDWAAFQGGSTYGDVFAVNLNDEPNPAGRLEEMIDSGRMYYPGPNGPEPGALDLDRILHHEERHSQQWARNGVDGMAADYGTGLFIDRVLGGVNPLEENAGLSDGGYPTP